MRILLVQPASNIMKSRRESKPALQPMGLAYIAGTLLANGYNNVEILDVLTEGYYNETPFNENYIRYGLSPDEIKSRIAAFKPDIVGVSSIMSLRKYQSHEICKLAKEVDPKITTIVGGNHHACFPNETLQDSNVDFVCVGEGEESMLQFVKWKEGKITFDNVHGIAFRQGGNVIIKPQVYRERNLDKIPFPAHHLLALDKHLQIWKKEGYHYYEAKKFTSSLMARGCPNLCEHCPHDVIFPGYRARSGKNIADEVELGYKTLGIEEFQFHEYNACVIKKNVEDFCHEMINRKLTHIRWGWPIGIWLKPLTYDFLALMRKAGSDYVDLAIESSNQQLLDAVMKGKDVDLGHTAEVIKWANDLNYYINCFFMIGFPNQKKEEIEATIEFAKTLDVDSVTFFIAQALPKTPLWNQAMKESLMPQDFDVFQLRYGKSTLKNKWLMPEEIENYRYEGRRKFIEHNASKGRAKYDGKRGSNYLQRSDWCC